MITRFAVVFFLLISFSSFSQRHHRVTFGVGVGKGFSNYFGPLIFLEPNYYPSANWSFGARLEGGYGSFKGSLSGIGSYSLNTYFYFKPAAFRPFVGLGLGFYAIETGSGMKCDCKHDAARGLPGFYPSLGFNYNHLVVKVEYNIVSGGNIITTSDMPGVPPTSSAEFVKPDYLSMKVGFLFGGGKAKEK